MSWLTFVGTGIPCTKLGVDTKRPAGLVFYNVVVMDSELKLRIAPFEQITVAMENIAPFQERFDQAAAVARGFVDLQENIRRSTERWFVSNQAAVAQITEQINSSIVRMVEMATAAAAGFERYRNESCPDTGARD